MQSPDEEERTGPVIRDRRRIDPVTGQVRDPDRPTQDQAPGQPAEEPGQPSGQHAAAGAGAPAAGGGPGTDGNGTGGNGGNGGSGGGAAAVGSAAAEAASLALAERTADLQRLQAEYANYRKRVERDRVAMREQALANVLGELLPILDDIGLAREHGELSGGFKSVADSLAAAVTKLGLTSYGEAGDPFDPNLHEALMHSYSADVSEPTCVRILQPGYMVGSRTLRAARVEVAEPESDQDGPDPGSTE